MIDPPVVPSTDRDIRARFDEGSFKRGERYFRNGAIFNARRYGSTVRARCQGSSEPYYEVSATLDHTGRDTVAAACSCPVGGGGRCKHVVALLLTWQARPEEFVEVEDPDAVLKRLKKDELVALVKRMLTLQPDLEMLLEAAAAPKSAGAPTINPETYRRQAAAAFRNAGYDEYGAAGDVAAALDAIVAVADGFIERKDFANAAAVYAAVLSAVVDNYETVQDEEGALHTVTADCIEGLDECLMGAADDEATRDRALRALFDISRFDVEFGGVGLADGAAESIVNRGTPSERATIAALVREALPEGQGRSDGWHRQAFGQFLLDLEADTLDDESFIRICRETGRLSDLLDRLLALGRVTEAEDEARHAGDFDLLQLADVLVRHDQGARAERLVAERARTSQDARLTGWLKQWYAATGNQPAELEAVERLFRRHPSLAHYEEARRLAEQLHRWEAVRPDLRAVAEAAGDRALSIRIALVEGEIDGAVEAVQALLASAPNPNPYGYGYGATPGLWSDVAAEVARAAEETRPRAAIEIYQTLAARLIAARGRPNYQQAAGLLQRVRELYQRAGDDGWAGYIAGVRDENRSLRALKEELAAAGL